MELRPLVRRFFRTKVGSGLNTNAWEDSWLQVGHLSRFFTYRIIHDMGFHPSSSVRDVLVTMDSGWPIEWTQRVDGLSTIDIPQLIDGQDDEVWWVNSKNEFLMYSTKEVWESLMASNQVVDWQKGIWFSAHIPKHAFCVWLACRGRLPTQDRLALWKHDPPDLICIFCALVRDSHEHLFFNCPFTKNIWNKVKEEVELDIPDDWSAIVNVLGVQRKTVHNLSISASVYFVWQERNRRMFSNQFRTGQSIVKLIKDVVLMRMAWKFKKRGMIHED